MPKISINIDDGTDNKVLIHLLQAAKGVSNAIQKLRFKGSKIEAVLIGRTQYIPYDQLTIRVIFNHEGLKQEKPLVQNPETIEIETFIEAWLLQTVKEYLEELANAHQKAATDLTSSIEKIKGLLPT